MRAAAAPPKGRRGGGRVRHCFGGPGCESGAGPIGSPPGPPEYVSHGIDGWKPTGAWLQSHTPAGNASWSRVHWSAVKVTL